MGLGIGGMPEASTALPEPRLLESYSRVPWTFDPRDTPSDSWLPGSHFASVAAPTHTAAPSPGIAGALDRAVALTAQAAVYGLDDRDAHKSSSLHLLAVELRREAGAWNLCSENYAALTRHFLARRDLKAASAYMHKLLFVTERFPDPTERLEACLLAASVHLEFGQAAPAYAAVSEAALIAARSSDSRGLKHVGALFKRIGEHSVEHPGETLSAGCACNGGIPYIECCGSMAFEVPAEFQVRLAGPDVDPMRPRANPWYSPGRSGIDVLMEPPGDGGECLNWVSVRVTEGRHNIVTLPNWSGRAMRTAKAMSRISSDDPEGTDGPSSTVLQVACGLEAFANAIHYFLARSTWHRSAYKRLPRDLFGRHHGDIQRGNAHTRLHAMGKVLFGKKWATNTRLAEVRTLVDLRDALVHFKGDNEETIVPIPAKEHPMVESFRFLGDLRAAPRPWIDRVLTPKLAQWSVDLGDEMIDRFRKDWCILQKRLEDAAAFEQDADDVVYSVIRGRWRGGGRRTVGQPRRRHWVALHRNHGSDPAGR